MSKIHRAIALTLAIVSLSVITSCKSDNGNTKTAVINSFVEFDKREVVTDGFKTVLTLDNKELLFNEKTAEVAVHDLASGTLWYSNPQDRESDKTANEENKQILASQIILYYQNTMNQNSVMYSYKHSVANGNFSYSGIDNGFQVIYHIGNEVENANLPKALTEKRYQELYDAMESKDRSFLNRQYSLVKYEKLTSGETKDTFLKKYPDIKNQNLYILRSSNKNIYSKLRELLKKYGYTEDDLKKDHQDAGYTENEDNPVFQVAINYQLENSDFVVTIPAEKIYVPQGFTVTDIDLLPYFAAQGKNEQGEIILPDGSGSVMKLNNGKIYESPYETRIYGGNIANCDISGSYHERIAHLPVFGISTSKQTVFAVLESGQSLASVHAQVSGMASDNNSVYASFEMAESEDYQLGNNVGSQISFYSSVKNKSDLKIRYKLWSCKKTYSDLANIYRNYLLENNLLTESKKSFNGVYINLTGAATYETSVLGIPCQKTLAMTRFDDAVQILKELKKKGITDISLSYDGWNLNGKDRPKDKSISISSTLGGKTAFKQLQDYCKENKIPLSLGYELQIAKDGDELFDGFSRSKDAVKTVTGKYGHYIYSYRKDTYVADSLFYVFVPSLYNKFSEEIIENFKTQSVSGIQLNAFPSRLVADYTTDKETLLEDNIQTVKDTLNSFAENKISITAANANDYALKYISNYVGMDTRSAENAVTDYSIPFMQMVLRDSASYSGKYFNYEDTKINLLKCIETGSNLCADFIYCESSEIKNKAGLDGYYSSCYSDWLDELSDAYKRWSDFSRDVSGTVVSHERLTDNVYLIGYSCGKQVLVNYSAVNYSNNGYTVSAESFSVVKGGIK